MAHRTSTRHSPHHKSPLSSYSFGIFVLWLQAFDHGFSEILEIEEVFISINWTSNWLQAVISRILFYSISSFWIFETHPHISGKLFKFSMIMRKCLPNSFTAANVCKAIVYVSIAKHVENVPCESISTEWLWLWLSVTKTDWFCLSYTSSGTL